MNKYYVVNTWTRETLMSGTNPDVLRQLCYGDDMVVDEDTWHADWECFTTGGA